MHEKKIKPAVLIIVVTLVLLLFLSLFFYTRLSPLVTEIASETDLGDIQPEPKSYRIGLSNYSLKNSWRIQMLEEARYEADQNPKITELIITQADDSVEQQIADVEALINLKVDAICISAINSLRLAPAVEKAIAAGIVVVDYDNLVDTENITSHIIVDNVSFGRIQASWLVDAMGGKGNVVVFNGIRGTPVSTDRYAGALSVFSQYPDITVTEEIYADWDYTVAKKAIDRLLDADTRIDGIWSQGGAMSEAIVEAFVERNMTIPPVTGEDGNGFLKTWKGLRDRGIEFESIATSMPTWVSKTAIRTAIDALDGKAVERKIILPIPVITAEQLDDFVRPDLSDAFWCNSQLPDDRINALFDRSTTTP